MKTVTVHAQPQPFGAVDAVQIVLCLLILAAAIWHARRERDRMASIGFTIRVLMPALTIAASFTLLALVQGLGSGVEQFAMALFMLLLTGLFSLILILLIELMAWRLRPRRTRRWIAGALLLFLGCFLFAPFALFTWLAPTIAGPLLHWEMLELSALVAAGALIWWSCLPHRPASLRRVFE